MNLRFDYFKNGGEHFSIRLSEGFNKTRPNKSRVHYIGGHSSSWKHVNYFFSVLVMHIRHQRIKLQSAVILGKLNGRVSETQIRKLHFYRPILTLLHTNRQKQCRLLTDLPQEKRKKIMIYIVRTFDHLSCYNTYSFVVLHDDLLLVCYFSLWAGMPWWNKPCSLLASSLACSILSSLLVQ